MGETSKKMSALKGTRIILTVMAISIGLMLAVTQPVMAQDNCGLFGQLLGTCRAEVTNEGQANVASIEAQSRVDVASIDQSTQVQIAEIQMQAQQAIENARNSANLEQAELDMRIAEIQGVANQRISEVQAEAQVRVEQAKANARMHVSDNSVAVAEIEAEYNERSQWITGFFGAIIGLIMIIVTLIVANAWVNRPRGPAKVTVNMLPQPEVWQTLLQDPYVRQKLITMGENVE